MRNLIRKILNESEFDWAEDVPSFDFPKDKHWIILIDNNDELLQAETLIRNEYGYSNDGQMFYDEDGRGGGLTAIEHDPEEGRTVDWLYDGRFAPHEYYRKEYPNASIYRWSDIQKETSINESEFEWTDDVSPAKSTWEELEIGDVITYQPQHFTRPKYYRYYGVDKPDIDGGRLVFRRDGEKSGILMVKLSYNNLVRDGYIK